MGDSQPTTFDVVRGADCSRLLELYLPDNFMMEITAVEPSSNTVKDCPQQSSGQAVYTTDVLNATVLLCLKVAIQGAAASN
jgi:hypothetical protein